MSVFGITSQFWLSGANGAIAQSIAGVSQPTSTIGFAHAVSRKLAAKLAEVEVVSAAVIVHEANFEAGHAKFPPQLDKEAASIVDEIRINGRISFILEVEYVGAESDERQHFLSQVPSLIPGILISMGYAGGKAFPIGPVQFDFGDYRTGLTEAEAAKLVGKSRYGFVLSDRRDLLEAAIKSGADRFESVVNTAKIVKNDDKWSRAVKGATCPISVGYQIISKPSLVRTHRDPEARWPSAVAETALSIGEWLSTKKIAQRGSLKGLMWRPYSDVDAGIFYASATGAIALQ